jgi:parvulin-like peptidyl-prolyl isomerase
MPPANQDPGAKKVLSESEAKAKAEKIYADLKAGADFVKLVKENSGDSTSAAKDGDFMPIRKSDQVPEEIKAAVFALKPGEFCPPIRQPNGFYVFRLQSLENQPFDKVREQLANELRSTRMSEWVQSTQKSTPVKIELEDAFKPAQPPAAADK